MQIGLYFGSFNPIHTGHLIIASYVLQHTPLEQVWLVISPQNPFKQAGSLLNEYDRLHLTRTALEGVENIKAVDIEFNLPKPSYTIDTMVYLEEKYPQHHFSIIIGSDGYSNLPKWKNAHLLAQRYSFYIYKRPNFPISEHKGFPCTVVNAPLLDISSTLIRTLIKEKKSIQFLVPKAVETEILNNRYYL